VNVVDSCGLAGVFRRRSECRVLRAGHRADRSLIVPTLTLFEVFKRILQQRNEADALRAIGLMRQGRCIDLTDSLALGAASLSFELKLPTGRQHHPLHGAPVRRDPVEPGCAFSNP